MSDILNLKDLPPAIQKKIKEWKDTELRRLNADFHRRVGAAKSTTYRLILSCPHPDSRNNVSVDRLREAFAAFERLEALIVKDEPSPGLEAPPLPKTREELEALRRKVQQERAMKRRG
jgi:hypothetical protein